MRWQRLLQASHRALQKAVRGLSPFPLAQACPGMQLLPNAAATGGYRILMDIAQTLLNIVGRQLMPSRPPGRPSGTWRCLALHLGSSAAHTALSVQLRPQKSRRRGLANGTGMQRACIACVSLPFSCISAAAAGTSAVHPVSGNQKEKEARIMKLKLITRPELPEPEVTIASAPKDKEPEHIVQTLQGIGGSLFAYRKDRAPRRSVLPYPISAPSRQQTRRPCSIWLMAGRSLQRSGSLPSKESCQIDRSSASRGRASQTSTGHARSVPSSTAASCLALQMAQRSW